LKFNPIRRRESSLEGGAYLLNSLLSGLRSTYEPGDPLGNMATFDVSEVLGYYLIGLHQEAAPVIPRAIEWLDIAIAQDEGGNKSGPDFYHRMRLQQAKAMALWLQSGDAATGIWNKVRELNLLAAQDNAYGKQIKTEGLDDYLCYCIQSEQYQAGITEYEKYYGVKKILLKRILSPRAYGYAFCLNEINPQYSADDLLEAGRKMLQANLEDHPWLGYGNYYCAAMWLKNVYWHHNRTLTPLETILKAYENMPGVPRPSFV
jgi:hypothetical protein